MMRITNPFPTITSATYLPLESTGKSWLMGYEEAVIPLLSIAIIIACGLRWHYFPLLQSYLCFIAMHTSFQTPIFSADILEKGIGSISSKIEITDALR
jgi:hypothetical protein